MKKKIVTLSTFFVATIAAVVFTLFCFEKNEKSIVVLYTTDVHTYINNVETDENGNEVSLLNYAKVAALKKDLEAEGKTVFLVDSGDNIQGSAYGGIDQGEGVRNLIDITGYDASAVGNHEFDYGMFRALEVLENSDYPYVSCNFVSSDTGELMIPAHVVLEKNGIKVGFIGVSTPETTTKTTPIYFENEAGEMIYDFCTSDDGKKLYDAVQCAVDEIRDEVDYVIVLSHLGDAEASSPFTSSELIENTTGIDAVLDGHSHVFLEEQFCSNKEGKSVIKSQAGCYLQAVGKMELSKSNVSSNLIHNYKNSDEEVKNKTDDLVEKVQRELGQTVAILDKPLYINDSENPEKRLVRSMDTNVSDFVADGVYWYFNEHMETGCDVAIVNGGGLRSDIPAGDFSFLSAKDIQPFGNVICMVNLSGQQIKDMLEWGSRKVGVEQNGGLMHVAGAKYTVDTSIKSTVQEDEKGAFLCGPTGEYRVSDIMIYNRETAEYEPIELDRTYSVAGANFTLRNGGDGCAMLKDSELIIDYVNEDYLVTSEFAKAFSPNGEGEVHINNGSSPLYTYKNYMYDYENPLGSGRLLIK